MQLLMGAQYIWEGVVIDCLVLWLIDMALS